MTTLVFDKFFGIAPRIPARRLPDGLAQVAKNIDTNFVQLAPLQKTALVQTLASVNSQSLYYYNGGYLTSDHKRNYVKSFQPNDTDQKLYYSDYPSYPKVRSGNIERRLGLPIPSGLTVGVGTVGNTTDETLNESRVYTYTYVDPFGFEGPAAPSTGAIVVGVGGTTTLAFPTIPSTPGLLVDKVYVYRLNSGNSYASFQFLMELTATQANATLVTPIVDNIASADLEEVLTAKDNYSPPDETSADGALRSLIELPGGVLAGHTNTTVYVTKPLQPHAWAYRHATAAEVVAIAPVPNGVLVLTKLGPYVLFGTSPEAMVLERLPSEQGCESADSVVLLNGAVYFASKDGLCVYSQGQVEVVTEGLLTREQWGRLYGLGNIKAFAYEGTYVAFDVAGSGFIFDASKNEAALINHDVLAQDSLTYRSAYRREDMDEVLLLTVGTAQTESVRVWKTGQPAEYQWRSGERQFPKPIAFSYLKIYAPLDGVANIKVFGDNSIVFQGEVPLNKLSRLPCFSKYRVWELEITGTTEVEMLVLTDSVQEMP